MSELRLHAVINDAKEKGHVDLEGNMSMQEIIDIFYMVILKVANIEDEEEFYTLLHMLVYSSIKE